MSDVLPRAALRESRARFRALVDSIDQGFSVIEVVYDDDGRPVDYRFVDVNPQFERHSGLVDPVGRAARELVPDLEPEWIETYARVAETGRPERFVQGSVAMGRMFEVEAFRLDAPERRRVGVLFTDVTERERDAAALRESEGRWAFLLSLTDALRPLADPDTVLYVAARHVGEWAGAVRAGYAVDEGDGEHVAVVRTYVDGAAPIEGVHRYDDYGPGLRREFRAGRTVVRPDVAADPALAAGARAAHAAIGVGATLNVPLVKAGRLVAVFFVHHGGPRAWAPREVALVEEAAERTWAALERVRAEDALRQSEDRLRQAVEAVDLGTWSYDVASGLTHFDARARALFGIEREALDQDEVMALVHPDDVEEFVAAREGALDPGGPGAFVETNRVVRPDGSVRWVRGRARVRFEGAGAARRPVGAVGVVHDVTELRRAEAELRDLAATLEARVEERTGQVRELAAALTVAEQEERRRIAYVLHDDLQQQLHGLEMLLGIARRAVPSDAEADRLLARSSELLAGATALTRTLSTELSPAVLDSDDLPEALRWLADRAREWHGLAVDVEAGPDVPPVAPAVRVLVYHVVRELLFNVAKHAGVGAAHVRVEAGAGAVAVHVEDGGGGFDVGARAEGFGLRSVRDRLELLGGRLDVASAPGAGTRATVTVPPRPV